MEIQILQTIGTFPVVLSVIVSYVTLVRWTRDSKDGVKQSLKRQFWVNHSKDLRYGVGKAPEIIHGDRELIIRGIEVADYGWWFEPAIQRQYPDQTRSDKLKTRVRLGFKRIRYGLYRNLVPMAGLNIDLTILVETKSCRIYQSEQVEKTDSGISYSGKRIIEEFPEITSLTHDLRNESLYRIGIDFTSWYEAGDTVRDLASSNYVKSLDFDAPLG